MAGKVGTMGRLFGISPKFHQLQLAFPAPSIASIDGVVCAGGSMANNGGIRPSARLAILSPEMVLRGSGVSHLRNCSKARRANLTRMNRIRKLADQHLVTMGWLPLGNVLLPARAGLFHPRHLNLAQAILFSARANAAGQVSLSAHSPAILSLCQARMFRSARRPGIGVFGRLLGSIFAPLLRLKASVSCCCPLAVVLHFGL